MRAAALSRQGGAPWIAALVLGLALLSVAVVSAVSSHERDRDARDRALSNEARKQSEALDHYFSRARSLTQVTANNPAFRDFYTEPGDRREKIVEQGRVIREANSALAYLEDLFPGSIGEACFIDRGGAENARAVSGDIAPIADLSPDETEAPFFEPTFALKPGQVYQAEPYLSPDTHDWVVSNSTPLPIAGSSPPAIVHFEISVDSFRREVADDGGRFDVAVVEARSGRVIVDSRHPQPAGDDAPLGRPSDNRFERLVSTAGRAFGQGTIELGGRPAAFRAVAVSPNNANRWVVVALAKHPATTWTDQLGPAEFVMGALSLLLIGFGIVKLRASHARLHTAAMTDPLTGLGNRRRLMADLQAAVAGTDRNRRMLLAIFDLDGFKSYNDTFGHPAGDALLVRLAASLRDCLVGRGTPYRLGGDEFCVIAPLVRDRADAVVADAERALTEHGEGFTVTCSHGSIILPDEAREPGEALHLVDQRMYAHKNTGRSSVGRQATDVLVKVLAERYPDIGRHLDDVTELADLVGGRLDLPRDEFITLLQAASLHDIGKVAIPDAILAKPGPLDDEEWAFIRQHTLVGERILSVAPALTGAARLVRASHERIDRSGYPDGLGGEEIPLGARIIAVCDAFDAMTSPRPYRTTPLSVEGALAELQRGAGSQFDAKVVEVFTEALREKRRAEARQAIAMP